MSFMYFLKWSKNAADVSRIHMDLLKRSPTPQNLPLVSHFIQGKTEVCIYNDLQSPTVFVTDLGTSEPSGSLSSHSFFLTTGLLTILAS